MNDKSLKKLNRAELLELLLEQKRINDKLEQELALAKEQLEDRRIRIEKSGSIAEAALALTDIFEDAQKAADLYLQSIKEHNIKESSNIEECAECIEPVENGVAGEQHAETDNDGIMKAMTVLSIAFDELNNNDSNRKSTQKSKAKDRICQIKL